MGKKRRYITGLDGIRAIAVIMVLAYHLKLALFKSGFLGVTVFFVLSGYLITGILISEVEEEGTIDLKNFWLRRIRRLVPAVMSMAVVIIFVSAVVNRVILQRAARISWHLFWDLITGGRFLIRYLTLKRPEYRHHLRIVGHWRLRHNFI